MSIAYEKMPTSHSRLSYLSLPSGQLPCLPHHQRPLKFHSVRVCKPLPMVEPLLGPPVPVYRAKDGNGSVI